MREVLNQPFLKIIAALLTAAIILNVTSYFIIQSTSILLKKSEAFDFIAFYTAAKLISQSPSRLYDLSVQEKKQQEILPALKKQKVFLPFLNPPFVAVFFSPLIYLSLERAYQTWSVINFILLGLFCLAVNKLFYKLKWYAKILTQVLIISFIPIATSLQLGQLSLLICLVYLSAWILAKKENEFLSGLVLSLLWIKPHYIMPAFIMFFMQKRTQTLKGLAVGSILLFLLSLLVVGPKGAYDYSALLLFASNWTHGFANDIKAQHTIQTALIYLNNAESISQVRLIWSMFAVLIIGLSSHVWRTIYRHNSTILSLHWALLIFSTLLISPHTHFHDLSLLYVAIIITVNSLQTYKNKRNIFYMFSLWCLLYAVMLGGFILDLKTRSASRGLWIITSVSYMAILFGIYFFSLNRLKQQNNLLINNMDI